MSDFNSELVIDLFKQRDELRADNERLTRKVAQLYEGAEEQRKRIKRLEEESESRWHLAQSAIGSCAEMSSRIQRLEEAGDVMASILNNTRKDWYTSDQCEVSRLIGTKLRRPSCECRATNTDSIGVSRLQPSTRTPRNRSRSPEAGGSDQATGGPHQTRIHSVL